MSQQTSGRRMKIGFSPAIHGVAGSGQMPSFRDLQAQARAAEQIGLDSLWVADHVVWPFPNQEEKGCWEAFTFLSGLAAVTSRIQLGPLVACTSFRNPCAGYLRHPFKKRERANLHSINRREDPHTTKETDDILSLYERRKTEEKVKKTPVS